MKARLRLVQRMLLAVLGTALLLSLLAFPRGRNRDYMAALEELSAFQAAFKQDELEKSLLSYAQSQGVVQLAAVAAQVTGPGVPRAQAKAGAEPIVPRADVTMRTLGDVLARSSGPSTVNMAAPSAADLGASIAWRLSRAQAQGPVTLLGIELTDAAIDDKAIARERSIPELHAQALAAEPVFAAATAKLEAAEQLLDQRRKWKASWKALLKADEARKDAKTELEASKADLDQKRARYESEAQACEKLAPAAAPASELAGLAKVALQVAGKPLTLSIPVALTQLVAQVPMLQGQTFPALHETGLWDEVKDKAAQDAIVTVRTHFTWHYQYIELGGLKIGGLTLLHLLPPVLPLLLFLLLSAIRRVTVSYNPFGAMEIDLPRVGLGPRVFDIFALTLVPFVGCILASISLTAIGQIPVLPVVSAFVTLGLGAFDYIEIGSLQTLTEAVVRTHSTPPPPKPAK